MSEPKQYTEEINESFPDRLDGIIDDVDKEDSIVTLRENGKDVGVIISVTRYNEIIKMKAQLDGQ